MVYWFCGSVGGGNVCDVGEEEIERHHQEDRVRANVFKEGEVYFRVREVFLTWGKWLDERERFISSRETFLM